jgi:cytochrome c oxidase assembly protein subunit 19
VLQTQQTNNKKKAMANNFSAQKQVIKPPQRGIFPLDHDSECRPSMEQYLGCLTESNSDHYKCRQFSRAYLECRMEKQLMAQEDLNKVGFHKNNNINVLGYFPYSITLLYDFFFFNKHITYPFSVLF